MTDQTHPNPAEERWTLYACDVCATEHHAQYNDGPCRRMDPEHQGESCPGHVLPVEVVPASALAQVIAERDKLTEALTQLIYAIDLPSELGKIGSYTYHTAALQRLHGALSFARTALSTPRADEEDPASQAYDAARWEQRVAEPDEEDS